VLSTLEMLDAGLRRRSSRRAPRPGGGLNEHTWWRFFSPSPRRVRNSTAARNDRALLETGESGPKADAAAIGARAP
jgi:hypothetical protein